MGENLDLIIEHGNNLIDLSYPVDEDLFSAFLRAYTEIRAEDPVGQINLICQGLGGGVNWSLPIGNIIANDGNVAGWLIGEASSSHADIFISCARRLAMPTTFLGLHSTLSNVQEMQPLRELTAELEELRMYNEQIAARFAKASNKGFDYWLARFNDSTRNTEKLMYNEMIALEVAEPVVNLSPLFKRPNPDVGNESPETPVSEKDLIQTLRSQADGKK